MTFSRIVSAVVCSLALGLGVGACGGPDESEVGTEVGTESSSEALYYANVTCGSFTPKDGTICVGRLEVPCCNEHGYRCVCTSLDDIDNFPGLSAR